MKIRKVESYSRTQSAYMTPSILTIGKKSFEIGCGNDDSVDVYQDKTHYYVLSENARFDYIGLESYNKETLERDFEIFMQSESEDKDWLLSISRIPTKIRFLLQWDM